MSESQNYEEVTVASDGVTVIKTFEADAFPVPAIAFRIKSDRTEAVTVRLADDVPENVAVEDLGFHPEYGSEHWTIEDEEITFEREIESEEQYTTVYGIRATGTDDVEQFLTEPTIEDVDPPLEDEDGVVGGSGSDVVRDVISGDVDAVPGLEDEDDEDIGTLDLTDPNDSAAGTDEGQPVTDESGDESTTADDEDDESESDSAETESDSTAEADQDASADGDASAEPVENVTAALASEIREGTVDDDDLDVLRDELDIASTNGSVDARVEKLQSDVSELDAYTDALEEFLDDNGTGQQLIEDFQAQLESVQEDLGSFESDIDSNSRDVDSVESGLEEMETDLNSLKADIKDLTDDVDSVAESLEEVESDVPDVDDLDERIEDIEDTINDLQEWRDQLTNVLGATED